MTVAILIRHRKLLLLILQRLGWSLLLKYGMIPTDTQGRLVWLWRRLRCLLTLELMILLRCIQRVDVTPVLGRKSTRPVYLMLGMEIGQGIWPCRRVHPELSQTGNGPARELSRAVRRTDQPSQCF